MLTAGHDHNSKTIPRVYSEDIVTVFLKFLLQPAEEDDEPHAAHGSLYRMIELFIIRPANQYIG